MTLVDTSLAAVRQRLTESQTVRHILERELEVAERHIDSLEEHRESLEADLVKDRQACKASIADQARALSTKLDQTKAEAADLAGQHERLGLAYQHCRHRIARRGPTGGTGSLQATRSAIDTVEPTRSALQAQLVDATETASRCVARLADTDGRMAALVAQIEQLEIAIDQNGSR
jgi:septal ring factor EnvC (AmiA/AmiB activator)